MFPLSVLPPQGVGPCGVCAHAERLAALLLGGAVGRGGTGKRVGERNGGGVVARAASKQQRGDDPSEKGCFGLL